MHVTCMDLGRFHACDMHIDMYVACMQSATMDCIAMAAGVDVDGVC